jgi:hypothetical protein
MLLLHSEFQILICSQVTPPWWDASWATWALVGVGIIAAFVAYSTLQDIKRQTTNLVNVSAAARASADAAMLNAQLMINAERAWIEVDLVAPTTQIDEDTGEEVIAAAGTANDPDRYGLRIANHGRTVARIIRFRIWHDSFPGKFDPKTNRFQTCREVPRHLLLAAGNNSVLTDFDIGPLYSDWETISKGEATAMLRIDVQYEDIIRGDAIDTPRDPHNTTAIFRYDREHESLGRLAQYNSYT